MTCQARLNLPHHSSPSDMRGGHFTCKYMKFNLRPRTHSRLVLRQLRHSGSASSHLR